MLGCGLCAVTFMGLGGFVANGALSYAMVIVYSLTIGTIGAFVMPARDSLLGRVAPHGIHRAVAVATLAQFAGQILGMGLATAAPLVGIGALLFGQAAVMAAAAFAATRVRPRPRGPHRIREGSVLRFMALEIGGGVRAVATSPVIAPVIVCAIGMGMCFMGAFAVLLPLIVQDYFPANLTGEARTQVATALGVFNVVFWAGSILSATVLLRFGHVRRKGAFYLAALLTGALVLILCSIPMPFWLLCILNFIWGLGGGVAMTLSRGLVQHYAPPDKVARVLSIFVLGTMGGCAGGRGRLRRAGACARTAPVDPVPRIADAGDRRIGRHVLAAVAAGRGASGGGAGAGRRLMGVADPGILLAYPTASATVSRRQSASQVTTGREWMPRGAPWRFRARRSV
jgi:MFS family permease